MAVGHFLIRQTDKFQLEVGAATPLFNFPCGEYEILFIDIFIKHTWIFLWTHDIGLEIENPIKPPLLFYGYIFLLELFRSLGNCGPQLLQLNWCRLHHQEVTWSYIVTEYGKNIRPESLRFPAIDKYIKYLWPKESSWQPGIDLWTAVIRIGILTQWQNINSTGNLAYSSPRLEKVVF